MPRRLVSSVALRGTISTYSMTAGLFLLYTGTAVAGMLSSAEPAFCVVRSAFEAVGRYRYRTASTPPSARMGSQIRSQHFAAEYGQSHQIGPSVPVDRVAAPCIHTPAQEAPCAAVLGKDPILHRVGSRPCGMTRQLCDPGWRVEDTAT